MESHWPHQLWCLLRNVKWPRNPNRQCWLWLGATLNGPGTYGRFHYQGERTMAHRSSWELWNNRKIPKGQVIRHLCHNPQCVNPAHLEPGTQMQNVRDMLRAGRQGYQTKLTERQRQHIKNSKLSGSVLAKKYKVSATTIHRIKYK